MTDRDTQRQQSVAELVAARVRTLRAAEHPAGSFTRPLLQTVPLVLAGTMSIALGTEALAPVQEARAADLIADPERAAPEATLIPKAAAAETEAEAGRLAVAAAVPSSVTVRKGDTVSHIAARYGLSTSKVLALNGLKANSLIHPGQVLLLKAGGSGSSSSGSGSSGGSGSSTGGASTTHTVRSGETVSGIAAKHGVSTQRVLDANKLTWSSIIHPGQKLVIPGKSSGSGSGGTGSGGTGSGGSSGSGTDSGGTGGSGSGGSGSGSGSTPAGGGGSAPLRCESVRYTVNSGDTVSKIAAKFGVTTQSVLNANGLTWTSIIYAGSSLTVPNPTKLIDNCVVTAALTGEMRRNAQIIVNVGRAAGVSDYGLVIALATAAQESGVRNIAYGDRDSLGLFQQRPSSGWGTAAQVMDPVHAAKAFFGGAGNPNKGKTVGLLDIKGWQSMTVTQAAQAVQRSATPNAYAKWEASARAWLAQLD